MEKREESTEIPDVQSSLLIEMKNSVRAHNLENRRARSQEEREAAGLALAAHAWDLLAPGTLVTCYASMPIEPSTKQLRHKLLAQDKQVALPIMQKGRALAWGFDSDELEVNGFGIGEPEEATIDISTAGALIIPALGAGLDGSRIGRGAGYYDRALENIPLQSDGGPIRIVVVFDDEVVESVPHEEHDQPVDIIVTPTRVIKINAQ